MATVAGLAGLPLEILANMPVNPAPGGDGDGDLTANIARVGTLLDLRSYIPFEFIRKSDGTVPDVDDFIAEKWQNIVLLDDDNNPVGLAYIETYDSLRAIVSARDLRLGVSVNGGSL